MRDIVPGEWADAPHLRVSELTREDLRRVLKSFLATGVTGYAAPFQHQGSGTINALVLAMLARPPRELLGTVEGGLDAADLRRLSRSIQISASAGLIFERVAINASNHGRGGRNFLRCPRAARRLLHRHLQTLKWHGASGLRAVIRDRPNDASSRKRPRAPTIRV